MANEQASAAAPSRDPRACGLLRFPSERDLAFARRRHLEMFRRHGELMRLRPLDHEESIIDAVYDEAPPASKRWFPDVELWIIVEWSPDPKLLKKVGIDNAREAVFRFTKLDVDARLADETLPRPPKEGDLIRLDANAGTLQVLVPQDEWDARENATLSDEQRMADGHGLGRELFAGMRRNALTAEEGACTWL